MFTSKRGGTHPLGMEKGSVDELLKTWFTFENHPDPEMLKLLATCVSKVMCCLANQPREILAEFVSEEMGFSKNT